MSVCVFWEERDCTASLLLCDHNLFLFIIFFPLVLNIVSPLFTPWTNQIAWFLIYCGFAGRYIDTYSRIRMAKLEKENPIIYKWSGRSASGSNSWPRRASLLLFSFQSIWYECAFTNIYFSSLERSVWIYFSRWSHVKQVLIFFRGCIKSAPWQDSKAGNQIPSGTFGGEILTVEQPEAASSDCYRWTFQHQKVKGKRVLISLFCILK